MREPQKLVLLFKYKYIICWWYVCWVLNAEWEFSVTIICSVKVKVSSWEFQQLCYYFSVIDKYVFNLDQNFFLVHSNIATNSMIWSVAREFPVHFPWKMGKKCSIISFWSSRIWENLLKKFLVNNSVCEKHEKCLFCGNCLIRTCEGVVKWILIFISSDNLFSLLRCYSSAQISQYSSSHFTVVRS